MIIMLGVGVLLCLVTLYSLCRVAGEADRKMENHLSQRSTPVGGE